MRASRSGGTYKQKEWWGFNICPSCPHGPNKAVARLRDAMRRTSLFEYEKPEGRSRVGTTSRGVLSQVQQRTCSSTRPAQKMSRSAKYCVAKSPMGRRLSTTAAACRRSEVRRQKPNDREADEMLIRCVCLWIVAVAASCEEGLVTGRGPAYCMPACCR